MPRARKVQVEKVEEKVEKVLKAGKVKKVKKPKKEKVKRKPSAYATFVKQTYHTEEIMALPSRDRFKAIAEKWSEHKAKLSKK